jgi:hypothetical protein
LILEIFNLLNIIHYKMAFELTDSNFKEKVMDHEGIAVVDFWLNGVALAG